MPRIRDPLRFEAGYASKGNSFCQSTSCKKKIEKGALRFAYRKESSDHDGVDPLWFHEKCFFRRRKNKPKSTDEISKFDNLKVSDQRKIKLQMGGSVTNGPLSSFLERGNAKETQKRKLEGNEMEIDAVMPTSSQEAEKRPEEKLRMHDDILLKQNKKMWSYRVALKKLTRKELEALFYVNNQFLLAGEEDRLDVLADGMAFGALERCSRCKRGQLIVNIGNYRCILQTGSGERCNQLFEDPPRKLFLVPEDLRRKYEFLSDYECEIERRVFEAKTGGMNTRSSNKPEKAIPIMVVAGAKSAAISERESSPHKVLVQVRDNNTAVDPQSSKQWVSQVCRDAHGNIYSAYFTRIDLYMGRNSYYKLQLLEPIKSDHRHGKLVWLFKSWGRIGTSRGDVIHSEYLTKQEGINMFENEFLKISGNRWANRNNFVKKSSNYSFVGVSYEALFSVESLCRLDTTVQSFVKFIFDADSVTELLLKWELNLELLPLGKLSPSTILKGFELLKKLEDYITNHGENMTDLTTRSYTNEFFTLIPHFFGNNNPPLLNTMDIVQKKRDLLNDLNYIDWSYLSSNMNKSDACAKKIDSLYRDLNTNLQFVRSTDADPELEALRLYFKNTQSHEKEFKLHLIKLFKVRRRGEEESFAQFESLHRQLLWHGTLTHNIPGILSKGLILPTGRPRRGFMFGNGIYFADRVSKSAQYCRPDSKAKPETGVLLLCEVALGKMHECREAEFIESVQDLPEGTNSVKGLGKSKPNPVETEILRSGVEVPLGSNISSGIIFTIPKPLEFNEYVIYDERQIKIKYLAWFEFEYTDSQP